MKDGEECRKGQKITAEMKKIGYNYMLIVHSSFILSYFFIEVSKPIACVVCKEGCERVSHAVFEASPGFV